MADGGAAGACADSRGLPLSRKGKSPGNWADMSDDDYTFSSSESFWSGPEERQPSSGGSSTGATDQPSAFTSKKKKFANRRLTEDETAAIRGRKDSDSTSDTWSQSSSQVHETVMKQQQCVDSATESSVDSSALDLLDNEPGGHQISVGSATHDEGTCKPCFFMFSCVGCQSGISCEFCHLQHRRRAKARPCKGKRERYRKLLERSGQPQVDCGPEENPDDSVAGEHAPIQL